MHCFVEFTKSMYLHVTCIILHHSDCLLHALVWSSKICITIYCKIEARCFDGSFMIVLHILPGSCITSWQDLAITFDWERYSSDRAGGYRNRIPSVPPSFTLAAQLRPIPNNNTVTKDTCDEVRLQYGVLVRCICACMRFCVCAKKKNIKPTFWSPLVLHAEADHLFALSWRTNT